MVEQGFGMWTAQDLSSRLRDLMRKRAGCGIDARTATKAKGEAMVHTRDLLEMLVPHCFGWAIHASQAHFTVNFPRFVATLWSS